MSPFLNYLVIHCRGYWVSLTFLIIGKATDDGNETCVVADGLVRFSILGRCSSDQLSSMIASMI